MAISADVQFDGRLTNLAIEYENRVLIADEVIPPTQVPNMVGTYFEYDKDERFTLPDDLVGDNATPNEIDWKATKKTFATYDHALEAYLSNNTDMNADLPINAERKTVNRVVKGVLLKKEKAIADEVFKAANYHANNQVDVAGQWATLSFDALSQLEAGYDACFETPNVFVCGQATFRKLSRNASILDAAKGTIERRRLNREELAEVLGVDRVLVGTARINTAKKGQTASMSRVWDGTNAGKGGAAFLRVANSAIDDLVHMSQFRWNNREIYRYPTTRGARGGTMVRCVETYGIKVVSTEAGYLFIDALVT